MGFAEDAAFEVGLVVQGGLCRGTESQSHSGGHSVVTGTYLVVCGVARENFFGAVIIGVRLSRTAREQTWSLIKKCETQRHIDRY